MKIEIAQNFVDMHKDNNIDNWQPLQVFEQTKKLETIYDNLINGVYGEVRENSFGEYEIEISGNESKSGNPIVFEWDK